MQLVRVMAVVVPVASSVVMAAMPPPFQAAIDVGADGPLVAFAQALLTRDDCFEDKSLEPSGTWEKPWPGLLTTCERVWGMDDTGGVVTDAAAEQLLTHTIRDGYSDDGAAAKAKGYSYKIHIPVLANRSIEYGGAVYDGDNNLISTLTARLHGWGADGRPTEWPSYTNDVGRLQAIGEGNTPTGLMEIDLNSPESNSTLYGKWPVNRVVRGLEGNAKYLVSTAPDSLRSGILIHTGEWPGWHAPAPMPNSLGCIHIYPTDQEHLIAALERAGVQVRPNPGGDIAYPYTPQGLLSVELID